MLADMNALSVFAIVSWFCFDHAAAFYNANNCLFFGAATTFILLFVRAII